MSEINKKTVCPLPWLHFSAHLDSTMRICCNSDHLGFVFDDEGKTMKLRDVSSISEYFNVKYYKNIRSKMRNGEKPVECRKCYEVEENGGASVRQSYLECYKDNEKFNESFNQTKPDGEIEPKVQSLDFSLSNNCNLKCIMCNPDASYPLKQDFDKLGFEYSKEFTQGAHINWKDETPIERLIPEITEHLKEFLTTGGEPFLSKTHIAALKIIIESGKAKDVTLSYHTNCTIRNEELFRLWDEFKHISVHFSIDSHGPLDEYIRYGTKWEKVLSNVEMMLEKKNVHAEVHTCVQALNIFNLPELYDWIATLKNRIPSLPYHIWMHHPSWLHINILPREIKQGALDRLKKHFEENKNGKDHFYEERSTQICSYLERSIRDEQDLEGLRVFKERIRKFEKLRGQEPVENLVPELKCLFE